MSDTLYPYYERELGFFRRMAQDFAQRYPAAAGRLLLEPNRSVDPHVERLIEAFALIAARIHHKIDDEFPELTEALLSVLYPHYLAPIPSMSTVQFVVDPSRVQSPGGHELARHSKLRTPPVEGVACEYRTAYPVRLWPLAVTLAKLQGPPFPRGLEPPPKTVAILRLQLENRGELPIQQWEMNRIRFHLAGERQITAGLYELIFNHTTQVLHRSLDPGAPPNGVTLAAAQAIGSVGFEREEGLLPYPSNSFLGYRLLSEFFAFPEKFHYFDLLSLDGVRKSGVQRKWEVVLFLNRTLPGQEYAVDAAAFQLGCTPVVNLFEQVAEGIPLTQTRFEYRVIPEVGKEHGTEVYAVESVVGADANANKTIAYEPFYAFRHGRNRENQRAFWHATRRPSPRADDDGTDVFLNLVDLDFNPRLPAETTLIVHTLCTNRDLPLRLQSAGTELALELRGAGPLAAIRCLRAPTAPLRPPPRRGRHWRLISHLNLNFLSLTEPEACRAALQEILRLYDFTDPAKEQQSAAVNRKLIEGIREVTSRPVVGRIGGPVAGGFARGVEVRVAFDEENYFGTGIILFAAVLERFLGLYVSLNSFSQLVAATTETEGYLKKWPPRIGEQAVL